MWKNGSTYFASFDQNCGFCSPGSGAWIHSSLHPLGPYTLQRNINRHLLPGCLPSDRPAAVNGKCGRGGYNYRNGEAITATADLGKRKIQVWPPQRREQWQARSAGKIWMEITEVRFESSHFILFGV